MGIISYAQNYEDVMLWRALKDVKNGFYIDVGAAWPEKHSITKLFYDNGWNGINIEPNPEFYRQLQQQRISDTNLCLAIGEKQNQQTISFIYESGLSTLDESLAHKHQQKGWALDKQLIEVTTLDAIWSDYVLPEQHVHFLKVDVEGLEKSVLWGNNWQNNRPWIVIVEATLPLSQEESFEQWQSILLNQNYQLIYADGLNQFFLANEHSQLVSAFKYPPNVFDDFLLSEHYNAEKRAIEAEKRAIKAETRAIEAETMRQDVLSSYSWTLTKPIRNIIDLISPYLEAFPLLWKRLNAKNSQSTKETYTIIALDDLDIYFANESMVDKRGIGRVSREILNQLKLLSNTSVRYSTDATAVIDERKKIYFYTSIHWCPDILLQPSIVMIHDVIPLLFPEHFPDAVQYEWNHRYKAIALQATQIVSISKSSANDISRILELPRDKIFVSYNGVTALPIAKNSLLKRPDKPYLVFLGALDKHKNIDVIFRALSLLKITEIELLIIGDNSKIDTHHELLLKLDIVHRIHYLGRLSDEDTGYIIKHSLALVFPSLYEGFGLPPMEAALLAVPSICSTRPAMTELLDDIALFADPFTAQEWADAITQLYLNNELRDAIRFNALKQVKKLTWKASAARLNDIFHKVEGSIKND